MKLGQFSCSFGFSPGEVTVTEASSNEPIFEAMCLSGSVLHQNFICPSLPAAIPSKGRRNLETLTRSPGDYRQTILQEQTRDLLSLHRVIRGERGRSPPLPEIVQSRFLHLRNSQGSARPVCNGRASPWANNLLDHCITPAR